MLVDPTRRASRRIPSQDRPWHRPLMVAAALLAAALVIAGCGSGGSSSSSGSAKALLNQTFSGAHTVNSGVLDFTLKVVPTGSKLLNGPVTLSLAGPFQDRGAGKLPASDFTISVSAASLHGSLSVISTGTKGYVTMSGQSYQLPQSSFRKLESGFAAAAAPAGGTSSSSGSTTLQSLGINPLHWLSNPTIVGHESVGGAQTTHIRAKVNVAALLNDLSHLAANSKLKLSGAPNLSSGIPAKTQAKIVKEVGSPSFDLWTGDTDKTVRMLSLGLRLPVTGSTSTSLGGMTSAAITLSLQYTELNKPQTITAPTKLKPYKQFQAAVDTLLAEVTGAVAAGSSSSSTSGSSSTGATTGNPATDQKYSQCITKAAGDVTQMQKCTSLLGG